MNGKYKFKMILNFSDFKRNYFLKLFDQKKKIEGEEIYFEFPQEIFQEFQYFLPTKIYILNQEGKQIMDFDFNLLKTKNTYHLLSEGGHRELYELLFYDEEKIELFVDNKEIKEFDMLSKFKRYSLVNIRNYNIKVNGTEINIGNFLPNTNLDGKSFQLSFYDIKNKYIVSKKIMAKEKMEFSTFYEKYINEIHDMSLNFSELKENSINFEETASNFFEKHIIIFNRIYSELNLSIPKKQLEEMIKEVEYLDFIYSFLKIKVFYIYYTYNNIDFDKFIKLFEYLEAFYNKLKDDESYKIYEKISVLLHLAELFNIVKKCDIFLQTNLHYIKVDNIEKNSVIYLALEFLNKFINDLNEESPSYFKLIEINSGIGFYKGNEIFSFDMIDISELKNHLKETIPSVICFYSLNNITNIGFTNPAIIGACINESKIFTSSEKFSLDKNCFDKRKFEVKNVAMKLALNLKHECFGHIKFQFHSHFCKKEISKTPRKCFDNKVLKKLVPIQKEIKDNTINILTKKKESDSGSYLESSYGKLYGTKMYTFVYLYKLKNIGALLDQPELFCDREKLIKLQKYAFYKFCFEKKEARKIEKEKDENEKANNEKKEAEKKEKEKIGIEKSETEKSENKKKINNIKGKEKEELEKEEKKSENGEQNEENLNKFNFDEELEYLINFFENDPKKKSIIKITEETSDILTIGKPSKFNKLLRKKRARSISKTNDDNNSIQTSEDEETTKPENKKKKKYKLYKAKDREKLIDLLNKDLSDSERIYYMKLFLETTYKE